MHRERLLDRPPVVVVRRLPISIRLTSRRISPAAFASEPECPDPGRAKPRQGFAVRDPGYHGVVPSSSTRPEKRLDDTRREARACRRCDLWHDATSVVFGEGPVPARVMLVGEQPGDVEDRRGEPFVGPAGTLLREVLGEVGLREKDVYLTNAVKHFKWRPKGTRRIHDTPNWTEIRACGPWLEAELALVRPKVLVCLGRIAAQALVGRDARVTALRGRVLDVPELAMPVVVTFHPSAVLRAGDERRRRRAELAMDLELARTVVRPARRGVETAARG
jgi:DNA polymerase